MEIIVALNLFLLTLPEKVTKEKFMDNLSRILSFIVIFVMAVNLNAQSVKRDSLGELVYENFLELKPRKLEYKWCDYFMKKASRMCNNDSLILPYYTIYYLTEFSTGININSTTCKELLKKEYGFIEKDILDGDDVIPSSISCFEEYTVRYVQDKFGINFFKNRKKEADSLDAVGMGFVVAQPKSSCDSIRNQLKKKMKTAKVLIKDKEFMRWMTFNVSESGKVSEVTYSAKFWDGFGLIKDDKYEKKVLEIMAEIPNWSPATLRGKPVSSEVIFVINETWR